jgi:hypothetical protein
VAGYGLRGSLAAAQSGGDQVVGVSAVRLGTCRTARRAAVVAADEEPSGWQSGRVELVEDAADLAGLSVNMVFGAVTVEAYGIRAAAQSRELAPEGGHGAQGRQRAEFGHRWCGVPGDDGRCPFG